MMFDNLQVNIAGGLDIPLPKMARVRQRFVERKIEDVATAVSTQVNRPEIAATIQPGAKIAIGVGSRGIANLETAVRALVAAIKAHGGDPFIFPAMGSHGGATVEGQTRLLATYGITEERVGAPVRATMDTVLITQLADGTQLHMDAYAHAADGVVLINRIKPHTNFRGDIESGIIKMMVIGMGKIAGATILHSDHGMSRFPNVLPPAATALMEHIPFLFGVGLVEDAYDHTAVVEAILGPDLISREAELQVIAKRNMARLYFDQIDVLVIEQMGKEISGAGFDPNITGRNNRHVVGFDHPHITKIVVLDLTKETHGNATGMGLADVITNRFFKQIDFASTYANTITSAYLDGAALPIVMPTDHDAIALAVKATPRVKSENARIVRIKDTLSLGEIEVSEPLLAEVETHDHLTQVSELCEMGFDENGRLCLL
ncbi:MAG: hypothetical protein AAF614_33430 [Chloroflexota bacterium]